jgi:hypothetical protein
VGNESPKGTENEAGSSFGIDIRAEGPIALATSQGFDDSSSPAFMEPFDHRSNIGIPWGSCDELRIDGKNVRLLELVEDNIFELANFGNESGVNIKPSCSYLATVTSIFRLRMPR